MPDDSIKKMVEHMDSSYQLSFVFDSETQVPAPEAIDLLCVTPSRLSLACSGPSDTPAVSAKVFQFSRTSTATQQSRNSSLIDRIINSIQLYN